MMASRLWIAILLSLYTFSTIAQNTYEWQKGIPVFNETSELELGLAGGLNAPQFSQMDLDGDGDQDLVLFERTLGRVFTFIKDQGTYQYEPDYTTFFPSGLKGWMLLRDFNCDGLKDIFTHTSFGIKVYQNTSQGSTLSWQLVADPLLTLGSSGMINLQVNIVDVPEINDIDGDGDLDILVYDFASGGGIEHHKNFSIENTGTCGLDMQRVTRSWGNFEECECDVFAFGETCEDLNGRIKHAGGKTVVTLDMNNDGAREVLIGQEDCEPLYALPNDGTADDALMTTFTTDFPSSDPIRFLFPAAYMEDLDGDGLDDLISAPNFSFNEDNLVDFQSGISFYRNTGTLDAYEFTLQASAFLQDQMIDVGENAVPAFADFDKDGDLDLFIGNRGLNHSGVFTASIWLYENTGTLQTPVFTRREEDYASVKSLGLTDLKPVFKDLNGDGNSDLIFLGGVGSREARLHVIYNNSSGVFSFDVNQAQLFSNSFDKDDNVEFHDIDGDQLIDLLVGRFSGRLDYLRNTGNLSSPQFELQVEEFYDIADDFEKKFPSVAVADIFNNGFPDLVIIDQQGILNVYQDFLQNIESPQPAEAIPIYNSISQSSVNPELGDGNWITTGTLNGLTSPDIVLGTAAGGVSVLRSRDATTNPVPDGDLEVLIFPNPAEDAFRVSSNRIGKVQLINTLGQRISIEADIAPGDPVMFQTSTLPGGIYIVETVATDGSRLSKRVMVRNP